VLTSATTHTGSEYNDDFATTVGSIRARSCAYAAVLGESDVPIDHLTSA